MALALYGHPFSSYTQKALIALYENATPFEFRQIDPDHPAAVAEWAELWPLQRFPVLTDAGRTVVEATSIIEHLAVHHPGQVRLIPDDAQAALDVRMLDRIFDNYVMTPTQTLVDDRLRAEADRDPFGVAAARHRLDQVYAWLEAKLAQRHWATGGDFSLADCAAAPSLFYADWAYPIAPTHVHLRAYRARLLARPSFARAIDEARIYRVLFPLGAPDRD